MLGLFKAAATVKILQRNLSAQEFAQNERNAVKLISVLKSFHY